MLRQLKRQLVSHSPEPALRAAQRLRHGERPWGAAGHGSPDGAEVVDSFDAHAVRRATADAVRAALEQVGVDYVALPDPRGQVRQLAVPAEDRTRVLAALQGLDGPGWQVEPLSGRREAGVRVERRLVAATGQPLGGAELGCVVTFWAAVGRADVPSPDGGCFAADTRRAPVPNDLVAYLTRDAWDRAQAAPHRWASNITQSIFEVREPVDLVYTWVDGSDRQWLARKDEHAASVAERHHTADSIARFTSRDELRYSLRSVAMYASWVRRIFLVTDHQVPTWLDVDHPQIQVVDHTEIFRDRSALPVFNSHAIESQLHHIAGLSEHYLYVNDDVFFGRPVEPELFFHGNGIAKFFLSPDAIDIDPRDPQDLPVITAAKNHRELMIADFGVSITNKFQHGSQPQLRSVVERMEQDYPELFDRVAHSRLRHPDDLSIASVLHHYYAFALRRAVPAEMDYLYQDISRGDTPRRLDAILRRRPQVFCLNDIDTSTEGLAAQQAALSEFFDAYFPVASPYELPGR